MRKVIRQTIVHWKSSLVRSSTTRMLRSRWCVVSWMPRTIPKRMTAKCSSTLALETPLLPMAPPWVSLPARLAIRPVEMMLFARQPVPQMQQQNKRYVDSRPKWISLQESLDTINLRNAAMQPTRHLVWRWARHMSLFKRIHRTSKWCCSRNFERSKDVESYRLSSCVTISPQLPSPRICILSGRCPRCCWWAWAGNCPSWIVKYMCWWYDMPCPHVLHRRWIQGELF